MPYWASYTHTKSGLFEVRSFYKILYYGGGTDFP
jgi:hypothetical protein